MLKINNDIIRFICSDVDGTLVNSRHVIPPLTKMGIQKACADGVLFGICSGRMPKGCIHLIEHLEIGEKARFIIGANGAAIYDCENKKYISNSSFDLITTNKIIGTINKHGGYFEMLTLDDDELMLASDMTGGLEIKTKLFDLGDFDGTVRKSLIDLKNNTYRACKIVVFFTNDKSFADFCNDLKVTCNVDPKRFNPRGGDIVPQINNKWDGILKIIDFLNSESHEIVMNKENVLYFGDQMNDYDVFKHAKYAVAMENGHQTIKKMAFFVCPTNDSGGIGSFLINHLASKK